MKAANVRRINGVETIREPYRFAQEGAKFDPEFLFLPLEESNYLNDKLPDTDWLDVVTDDPNFLENVNLHGYRYLGKKWKAIFVVWRESGKAICVPADSPIDDLRDIGVVVDLGPITNAGKVGKYINRLFAPLPKGNKLIHGILTNEASFVDREDTVPLILEKYTLSNGAEIQIIYDDMDWMDAETKATVDGAITLGPDAAVALELSGNPKLGDAWRGTFGTRQGIGKGHILLVPSMGNYVRIYGPKRLTKTTEFTFGSMGPLHVGIPHTDPQAYWNFDFDRPELGEELARKFMRSVREAVADEEKLRETFLRYSFNPEGSEAPDLEEWLLRKALAYNIPIVSREDVETGTRVPGHPGLIRRVASYLMKKVMDCENGRIPMEGVAVYGYVLPDPFIFNAWGMPNLTLSRLDDGEIVMPDIEKGIEVVVYRQPSENDNAHFYLTTVMSDAYKPFAGRGICLLGRGAKSVLNRLGGGDMDDMFVIVHDPVWVDAFRGLKYPETDKLEAKSSKVDAIYEGDEFFEELASTITDRPKPGEYGRRQFSYQIEQARKAGVGIGPVVNMGGIDKLLSQPRHRDYILQQLEAMDKRGEDVTEVYAWYIDRKPYQAAKYMTNLELVIDGNVKDETLLDVLGNVTEDVKRFHEDLRIYPTSMERRIPSKKAEKRDFILLDSLMCRSLKRIASMRDKLTEVFREMEWLSAGPADRFVLEYFPVDKDIKAIVNELREIWRTEWEKVFQGGVSAEDRNSSFANIEDKIEEKLKDYQKENMQEIAVELYRQTYRKEYVVALTDATGRRRTFPDSLLWTHKLGSALIDAFHTAGVAGATTGVELMPEFRRLQRGKVKVKVTSGLVERISNGELIGYCIKPDGKKTCPDGEYTMSGGTITWRKCTLGL